jgi:Xaa-Pro aminopeptidase
MAFAVTDGETTLYTDFPYESGYSGYMTYDFAAVPKAKDSLCLITHGHRDHFDAGLLAKMSCRVVAPADAAATLPADRVLPLAPRIAFRGIEIQPVETPHARIGHDSYLVTWHGARLYFTGDTDSTDALLAQRDLDAAFVSPWLLEAVANRNATIDARRVVVYHHRAGERAPDAPNRVVPRQGDAIRIETRAAASGEIPGPEFRARREEAMRRLSNGVLLLAATPFDFDGDQLYLPAFQQNPTFFYFTGLAASPGVVLALDGPKKRSLVFVPAKLPRFDAMLSAIRIPPGPASAGRLGVDEVRDRKELAPWLAQRQEETPVPILYAPALAEGPPKFLLDAALDDPSPSGAWNHALAELWTAKRLRSSDAAVGEMRAIKSAAEIETMRRVGRTSAAALLAGLAALAPGRPQREAEAAVVSGCIAAGAEGHSFWPWVMAGENGAFPKPFESLVDYRHLNRRMQAGELARVDVGCDADHYKGDVGRTAPVSGRFDPGQRETWELLVAAWRAGLALFRDGVRRDDIFAASLAEVRRLRPSLATPLGRKAADVLLGPDGLKWWGIHGVGLEGAEGAPDTLRAGMVVAFEPIFVVDGQGFYLEDMILVTRDGHEVLTPGLPYTADEVERAVRTK